MKSKPYQFTVTRQQQWPDGNNVVEVSAGGIDYCNPDALSKKYTGEFETFTGKVPAVKAAIAIAKAWQRDCPDKVIEIATGSTGGMTMPFSGEPLTDEVFADLLADAEKHDEKIPKCAHCGDPLIERWGPHWMHADERECCSENCANNHYTDEE